MASSWWWRSVREKAGKAQSPWSARCSWCTARPTSTCYSSVGVGASPPQQTPPQSRALNSSTYRPLWGSPRCSRKGSASAGRREGESGSSDHPPPKRGFPDRIACRVSPGGGHCLLEDKEVFRKGCSQRPRAWCTRPPRRARTACAFHSAPALAPCCLVLPEPFGSAAAFIRWQWPRSDQIMDPCQRPRGTPHHWTPRNALHQATQSFASLTLGMLRGPSAHWHSRASPALAQESGGNCQDGAGPETTSVRTSQQIKAMMLLQRTSGRRWWAKKACRQAFAVRDEQFNPTVFKRKAYLWLSCQSQPNSLYKAAALATRKKTD